MAPRIVLLALALAFTASSGTAQEGPKKTKVPADNDAMVSFTNGSLVRMAVLQKNFEVETEFGKLVVPAKQLRRIDFGVHLPEGAEDKIKAALQKLSGKQFKDRDAAVNDLVAQGRLRCTLAKYRRAGS